MSTEQDYDLVGALMDYEIGALTKDEVIELFARLIESGLAFQLQGAYGRQATALIEAGYISETGEIL